MIHVTRLNYSPLVLNCDLIESVEMTPDTVITLTTGQKIMVLESSTEIIDLVAAYWRKVLTPGRTVLEASQPASATGVVDGC